MSIEIKNLSYVYNPKSPFEKRALDKITLTVEDGDFFGIIGQTGSGKSTLVSHFNALTKVQDKTNVFAVNNKKGITADALTILNVGGLDLTVKKPDYKLLREKVGMVFQYPEYQLFADTVALDVGYGPKNLGLDKQIIDERVKQSLELVGLDPDEISGRSPFELSGGQKRRVAIAGVIAMRPEILILDEPTAGLDPRGKKEVLSLIKNIKESCSHTIIMVSHNMDEIAECCNRVAVLGEGKLKGIYKPSELFAESSMIKSLGLELPTVTELAEVLNNGGIKVDKSVLSERALLESIYDGITEIIKESH